MKQLHCMLDLETLGNSHDAAIIQIGWCIFDRDSIITSGGVNVNFDDALKHGTVTGSTLQWWLQQSEEARQSVTTREYQGDTLWAGLNQFVQVMLRYHPLHYWAHATFDFPILAHAFKSVNAVTPRNQLENPIGYKQTRDLRTLDMLANAGECTGWPVREGTHHNAVADAIHQAKCVQLMLNHIGYKEIE